MQLVSWDSRREKNGHYFHLLSGEDITNIMPYLAAYLGHADFRGTQYYLRLTADLYPDIISRTEAEFGYVIPKGDVTYEK